MQEEEIAKGKASMTHERNLELITSSLAAEVAAGDTVVGNDLLKYIEEANEMNVALNFEEKLLAGKSRGKFFIFLVPKISFFQIVPWQRWDFWMLPIRLILERCLSVPKLLAFKNGFRAGN